MALPGYRATGVDARARIAQTARRGLMTVARESPQQWRSRRSQRAQQRESRPWPRHRRAVLVSDDHSTQTLRAGFRQRRRTTPDAARGDGSPRNCTRRRVDRPHTEQVQLLAAIATEGYLPG